MAAPARGEEPIVAACEGELATLAAALAGPGAPVSEAERAILPQGPPATASRLQRLRRAIAAGGDPLGDAFCRLRSPKLRRRRGAIYTPRAIVDAMVGWAAGRPGPARIVDPGAGSGRFLLAAARAFPEAELLAVEIEPLAALVLRANAAVLGLSGRLTLLVADYRSIDLPEAGGPTLFLGNPPYLRHHAVEPGWKDWLAATAATFGIRASRLAGLHVHFFVKTRQLARPGDWGAFVTSAEWLDTRYGETVRRLFAGELGGTALHVIDPAATPFADAAITAAIACFHVGRARKAIRLRPVARPEALAPLAGGRPVARARLAQARRWSPFLRTPSNRPPGCIELGELCRVHRGQVTGCNAVWIAGAWPGRLPPSVLFPAITRAQELFAATPRLSCADGLRRVIDLPADLDSLDDEERRQLGPFLAWAKSAHAPESYVARHRSAWWAVGLRSPATILSTYMARRRPAFVRNLCGARHLNIAHGLYPRAPLPGPVLDALAAWLQAETSLSAGRIYAGGLAKFEPGEIERLPIPPLDELHERAENLDAGGTGGRRRNGQDAVPAPAAR